ncbi:sensor histidine kinase [Sporosarcina obsidiansis]|uniref:sensor histidine kinase n=1 Tax=Sporosarcina obsidiansis TaxID=2660748 RepID=UPI00129C0B1F|nr:HAMP domain-containing sensor histidine kinase [Sporosarcina obsidiansis]
MNKKIQLGIWSALVTIVLIALPSVFHYAPQIVGKTLIDQEDFSWRMERTYDHLGAAVLNPIDFEKAARELPVSKDEIEEHRNRFGTLAEQLSNIQEQYAERIMQAKEEKNETLLLALVKERDIKIEDIQKNFESDEHIEDKIRNQKAKQLELYIEEIENRRQDNLPISYELVNVDTGERFTKGDVSVPVAYKKKFDESNGYFKADSILLDHNSYSEYTGDAAVDSSIELTSEDVRSVSQKPQYFRGTVIVSKEALAAGGLYEKSQEFTRGKYSMYAFWVVGILSLVALLTVVKFRREWVLFSRFAPAYSRWKIDLKAAVLLLTVLFLANYIQTETWSILNKFTYFTLGTAGNMVVSFLLFGVLLTALLTFQVVHLIEQVIQPGYLEQALRDSYTATFIQNVVEMFSNRTIGVQLFILLIGFFLAGIGFVGGFIEPFFFLIYAACVMFLGLPALYVFASRGAYLNRIFAATSDMAAGHLTQAIPVKGKSALAKHAANLNNLREGVRVSINEQAKSERLKTELITNVSHDLRTPLTSIITYTDLLKDETLSTEERAKYVGILDQKSQRLKTLIEDLFEVSKMASGNLELTRQRVDLNQLMQQALAEHAEDFAVSSLDVRITLPEIPVYAMVDGQKWWRVLDNLLINALKYSLPGTRVYVNLQKVGTQARITIKNIAKYEIGDNTDELFERFKRGDESRQTEGSGLGLAIAQSIVDLHGGKMEVEVDGDLFKVTVDIVAG